MAAEQRPEQRSHGQQPYDGGENASHDRPQPEAWATPPISGDQLFRDERRQRMRDLGTNDPGEALVDMIAPHLVAHAQLTPDEQATARDRGRVWRLQREELCLTEDDVARRTGLSPHVLMFIEHGFPPIGGISEDVAQRLDAVLMSKPVS